MKHLCNSIGTCPECLGCGAARPHDPVSCEPCAFVLEANCVRPVAYEDGEQVMSYWNIYQDYNMQEIDPAYCYEIYPLANDTYVAVKIRSENDEGILVRDIPITRVREDGEMVTLTLSNSETEEPNLGAYSIISHMLDTPLMPDYVRTYHAMNRMGFIPKYKPTPHCYGAHTPTRYEGTGRNALCPCGSGRKFKRCCVGKKAEN